MSTPKRALALTSSGQPSQPKRPCRAPIDQEWSGSQRNGVPSSYFTVEDVQRVVRQELEHAMSHWAESLQSFIGNALKDIMQQMTSKENDFQKQTEAVELGNSSSTHLGRPNAKSSENNGARNLQLQFRTKLSHPLFTGKKIEGDEGARIYVALIDANTGDVVTSGPESSIKLDVVVLEGDFNKDNEDTWASEEFENYAVQEREGKGPLLVGDLVVKLKEGLGELGQLKFTDNSSWNRSKTFRIGVKVASGFCGNTRIQEAKTDAFPVKEQRGEAYRKHYPPASDDEVWRLEKIAKDGILHKNLSEAGIYKVENFLLLLFTDPKKLKEILGKSMTEKKWDSLVSHAKTCQTLTINTDNQPIGLVKDRAYFATHQLSAQEKEHGDTIVNNALNNWNNVREFNGETFSDSMQTNSSSSFPSQVLEVQIENLTSAQRNWAAQICATPVGPESFLANAGSTAEGRDGVEALTLPAQYSGNPMEISLDGISRRAAHPPMTLNRLNVLISPGDNGFATIRSPIQSHGVNFQCAMHSQTVDCPSQMDYTVNEHVHLCEPPPASLSQSSDGFLPEGNHMLEDLESIDFDDIDFNDVCVEPLADNPPHDEMFLKTLLSDDGSVRRTSKGVKRWLKMKAVLRWGFFYRRGVRIVPLDEPPNEVQA